MHMNPKPELPHCRFSWKRPCGPSMARPRGFAMLLALLLCAPAWAAELTVTPYVQVTTTASGKISWFVASSKGLLTPFPLAEKSIGFGGDPGQTYTVIMLAVPASGEPDIGVTVITMPGPAPGPGPQPPPGPDPQPVPSGTLAKQMLTWLAPLKGKVTAKQLTDVAATYESIAAQAVATPGTMTRDGFIAATQTQNVNVLGPSLALEMRDPFFKPLAVYMTAKNLKLDDEPGHAALWREVAAAITEASKSW